LLGNFFYNLKPELPFYITATLTLPMVIIIFFRIHQPKKDRPQAQTLG